MPVNTGYLSNDTTNLSNVSLYGSGGLLTSRVSSSNTIVAAAVWASGFSALGSIVTTSRVSSDVSIVGNAIWASSFSAGGKQIIGFSTLSVKIPASVVQGSSSTFTVGVWSGLVLGDVIMTSVAADDGTASSISSGLVYHSHATATGRYEFRYSNVSTLEQAQSAKSFNLVAIRPF